MNKISRIVARDIILDESNHLWNEDEARIIRNTIMVDIPRAGNNEDLIDRSLAIKTFKYNHELSDQASYVVCRMLNRIPPAIFGVFNGQPNARPKPLAPEQLRALDGDPVWVYNSAAGACFWMLAYSDSLSNRLGHLDYNTCGKTWQAYGMPRTY